MHQDVVVLKKTKITMLIFFCRADVGSDQNGDIVLRSWLYSSGPLKCGVWNRCTDKAHESATNNVPGPALKVSVG